MKRSVVHFVDSEIFGGCEQVVLSLLTGLDREEWCPVLLYHGSSGVPPLVQAANRFGIACWPVPQFGHQALPGRLRRIVAELRALKADLFHVHLNWPLACRHEVLAARLAGIGSVVATSHLTSSLSGVRFSWLKQKIQDLAIDRYIAVSDHVQAWLCSDMNVRPSKVRVVKNGVSIDRFRQSENHALGNAITDHKERQVVLSSGRLHSEKGYVYLLEAAKLVPDALFLLAGDGPERTRLEEYARKIGVEERIRFLGHRDDIPQLLAFCDVFVLPSLHEALGLSVLEAMAAGKPVVATSVGGIKESVADGITGLLVPPRNSESLAAAVRRLLSDDALATGMGEAGRARVIQSFSSEGMIQGVTRVYDELVTRRFTHTEAETSTTEIQSRLNA